MSHYWDCRLKGRPSGTPKSEDPNKKKRKRTARQRDLCDVKIKITEYFPGAMPTHDFGAAAVPPTTTTTTTAQLADPTAPPGFFSPPQPSAQAFGMLTPSGALPDSHAALGGGGRYYTIQRVNGNGGNGKGDGVAGPHKHTLEDSDRVKKNSVTRNLLKDEKERKKSQVREFGCFESVFMLKKGSDLHWGWSCFVVEIGPSMASCLWKVAGPTNGLFTRGDPRLSHGYRGKFICWKFSPVLLFPPKKVVPVLRANIGSNIIP